MNFRLAEMTPPHEDHTARAGCRDARQLDAMNPPMPHPADKWQVGISEFGENAARHVGVRNNEPGINIVTTRKPH
jgi:hypothetical protein